MIPQGVVKTRYPVDLLWLKTGCSYRQRLHGLPSVDVMKTSPGTNMNVKQNFSPLSIFKNSGS